MLIGVLRGPAYHDLSCTADNLLLGFFLLVYLYFCLLCLPFFRKSFKYIYIYKCDLYMIWLV